MVRLHMCMRWPQDRSRVGTHGSAYRPVRRTLRAALRVVVERLQLQGSQLRAHVLVLLGERGNWGLHKRVCKEEGGGKSGGCDHARAAKMCERRGE